MKLVKLDIDQLLENTSYIHEEEDFPFDMREIEIDMLLAVTKDW
jgi:hypothetical protein